MPGKKHKAVKSEAQRRMLFLLAERGELPMSEAVGKSRAARGKKLPEHVKATKKGKAKRKKR